MNNNLSQKNIPQGWSRKKLSDILDYERPDNYIVKSTSYNDKAKTPVLTANKSFILGHTDEDFGIYENVPAIIFDDFTTDSKYVDFPFKIKSSAIKILKCKDETSDLKFIHEKMKTVTFPVANHKRYYISQYQDLDILLPEKHEQQKIAEILGAVDEDIAKTQEVIEATEKLKRGLMQQLFTHGINKVAFDIMPLGRVAKVQGGYSFKSSDFSDKGVPVIRISNIKDGYIKLDDVKCYSKEITERLESFSLKKDDVVIAMSGATTGKIGIVTEADLPLLMNQRVGRFVTSADIDKKYLYNIVISEFYQKRMWDFAIGGAQPNVSGPQLESIEIPLPTMSTQREIAEILSAVDEKISINKKLKEKLTLLKKGLMQDLLSGKVRTINI